MAIQLTETAARQIRDSIVAKRGGMGLRLGVNAGYMKFSKKQKWLPF